MDMDVRLGLPRVIREMMITLLLLAVFVGAAAAWAGPAHASSHDAAIFARGSLGTEAHPRRETPAQRPRPSFLSEGTTPLVSVYGAAGTFGSAGATGVTPTGEPMRTQAVDGWGFLPGQAAYFPTVASDGTVLIANEPQTDNQLMPTARQLVVSTFQPTTGRFRNVVVPTSTGRTELGGPWPHASSIVGGGDVSDIATVKVGGEERVAFTSAMPYWGWDAVRDGVFPTLGFLMRSPSGDWVPDPGRHVYARDIAASASKTVKAAKARATRAAAAAARAGSKAKAGGKPKARAKAPARSRAAARAAKRRSAQAARAAAAATPACDEKPNAAGQPIGDCHMPAELAQLPSSGAMVVTQYALDDAARRSGRISVLDTAGRVKASYAYPSITLADGRPLSVHPREVDADPLGRRGDERFVVIFDSVTGDGTPSRALSPFAMQEFRYDARHGTLLPTSAPVLSGDAAVDGTKLGFETAEYGRDGTLWAAQSKVGTLQAGPVAIFRRATGSTSVLGSRAGCGASAAWRGQSWGKVCRPDERVAEATPLGIGRSLVEDAATGTMVLATMSGYLLPVRPMPPAAPGGAVTRRAAPAVDLGLGRLVDRDRVAIGPRKAAVDGTRRTLWLPIQQLATDRTCAAWPCAPAPLDQWLVGVDLAGLLARPGG